MKRTLLLLVCLVSIPAFADAVGDLARSSAPSVINLGRRMALAEWNARVDELLLNAPVAPSNGKWKRGDSHFDAAHGVMMGRFEKWAADLASTPRASQLVDQSFPKSLGPEAAAAASTKLSTPPLKDYAAFSDRNNAMVEFAVAHPDVQIGTSEFTRAFEQYSEPMGLARVKQTAEMAAFATSPEGRAYDTARSFAARSVKTFIEGELQLAFFDHQQEVLDAIRPHAQACAKAHK